MYQVSAKDFAGNSVALAHPPRDAFARMLSWADDLLPSWCDSSEPVAAALQAADLIRHAKQQHRIDPDDIHAARLVIDYWNRVLLVRLSRRQRLRAYFSDWTLAKYVLLEHQTVREVATRLGLDPSGSTVARRLAAAVASVAASVGPFEKNSRRPGLKSQTQDFVAYTVGVGHREIEPRLPSHLIFGALKAWTAELPAIKRAMAAAHPDHGGTSAGFIEAHRKYQTAKESAKQLRRHERPSIAPAPDDPWLIAEALEYFGEATRLPPGCADEYPGRSDGHLGHRDYDREPGKIWIIPPRAAIGRGHLTKLAAALPKGQRQTVHDKLAEIGQLESGKRSAHRAAEYAYLTGGHFWTSKPVKRSKANATTHGIRSNYFTGPVVEIDGKLYPRSAGTTRKSVTEKPDPILKEIDPDRSLSMVDRIERSAERPDDFFMRV